MAPAPDGFDGNPIRVLVVEDHPILSLALCELLASDERLIVLDAVASGSAACTHPLVDDVDVALIDIGLPDVDGVQVMRSLRCRNPGLRVVIMSGSGHDSAAADALADGAHAYLEKGALHDHIAETIVSAMRGSLPVSTGRSR